jgi:hypothetical protein
MCDASRSANSCGWSCLRAGKDVPGNEFLAREIASLAAAHIACSHNVQSSVQNASSKAVFAFARATADCLFYLVTQTICEIFAFCTMHRAVEYGDTGLCSFAGLFRDLLSGGALRLSEASKSDE